MNKSQAKSRASQRHTTRVSDEDRSRPPWLVVAFRVGTDNQGRRKVYRIVAGAWSVHACHDLASRRLAAGYACVV